MTGSDPCMNCTRSQRDSRIAYVWGATCPTWGGRPRDEDWILTEAEFSSWTPSEFDKYVAPNGWALEPKGRATQHIETWRANALNMSRMFSSIYGNEWYGERAAAVGKLRDLHINEPRKFTLPVVKDAWGTLNRRWAQELKELTNQIRLHAKVERPTFEQIKLIGMTVIQSTGDALFQRPKAFDLDDPSGYSLSEIVRKMVADNELNSWPHYHSSSRSGNNRDRLGARPDQPYNLEHVATLPGPPTTAAERRIAGSTAPKASDGRNI